MPVTLGLGDGLGGVLRGGGDGGGGAGGELHRLQVVRGGERQLEVADGALGLLHVGGDVGGAGGRLAALALPGLRVLVGPLGLGRRVEVLGQVVRGARVGRAVERLDVGAGELGGRVELLDRLVVPLGDRRVEDLREGRRVQDQVVDARQVVADRDRAADHRQVDALAALADGLRGGDLFGLQRRVGARDADAALVEGGDALTRGGALVVDVRAGARLHVVLDPDVHRVLLRAGAGGEQLPRLRARDGALRGVRRLGTVGRGVVVGTTGGQDQRAGNRDRADGQGAQSAVTEKLHLLCSFQEPAGGRRSRGMEVCIHPAQRGAHR
ncbi:hypothetical protein M2266_003936 [Streptomyces sp. SPB162]|nr:hypothetical protein [Streptomyces sp. SPB162]